MLIKDVRIDNEFCPYVRGETPYARAHDRLILIDVRTESNLEEGKLCPKARKRKLQVAKSIGSC